MNAHPSMAARNQKNHASSNWASDPATKIDAQPTSMPSQSPKDLEQHIYRYSLKMDSDKDGKPASAWILNDIQSLWMTLWNSARREDDADIRWQPRRCWLKPVCSELLLVPLYYHYYIERSGFSIFFFGRSASHATHTHTHRCHTFSNIYQDQNWIRRKRRINVYGYIYIHSICSPTRPSNSRYAYLIYWNAWAFIFIGSSSWKRGWSTILICILWHRRVLYMYIDSILMIIILLIWQIECEN